MEEREKVLNELRIYQQQLQSLTIQKESLKLRKIEIENALEELKNTKQNSAYKISGNIMILKPIEELKKELEGEVSEIDLRLKSLEKAEEKIVNKLKELQKVVK